MTPEEIREGLSRLAERRPGQNWSLQALRETAHADPQSLFGRVARALLQIDAYTLLAESVKEHWFRQEKEDGHLVVSSQDLGSPSDEAIEAIRRANMVDEAEVAGAARHGRSLVSTEIYLRLSNGNTIMMRGRHVEEVRIPEGHKLVGAAGYQDLAKTTDLFLENRGGDILRWRPPDEVMEEVPLPPNARFVDAAGSGTHDTSLFLAFELEGRIYCCLWRPGQGLNDIVERSVALPIPSGHQLVGLMGEGEDQSQLAFLTVDALGDKFVQIAKRPRPHTV